MKSFLIILLVMGDGKCQGTFRMLNKNLKWQWLTGTAQVVFKGNEPDFIITTNRPLRLVPRLTNLSLLYLLDHSLVISL